MEQIITALLNAQTDSEIRQALTELARELRWADIELLAFIICSLIFCSAFIIYFCVALEKHEKENKKLRSAIAELQCESSGKYSRLAILEQKVFDLPPNVVVDHLSTGTDDRKSIA